MYVTVLLALQLTKPTLENVLRNAALYTKKSSYCSELISSMTKNLHFGISLIPRLVNKLNQREGFHKDLRNTDTSIQSEL